MLPVCSLTLASYLSSVSSLVTSPAVTLRMVWRLSGLFTLSAALLAAILHSTLLHPAAAIKPFPVIYPGYVAACQHHEVNVNFNLYVQGGLQTIDGSGLTSGFML